MPGHLKPGCAWMKTFPSGVKGWGCATCSSCGCAQCLAFCLVELSRKVVVVFCVSGGLGAITLRWEQCRSRAHCFWESPGRGKPGWLALLQGPLAFILPVL